MKDLKMKMKMGKMMPMNDEDVDMGLKAKKDVLKSLKKLAQEMMLKDMDSEDDGETGAIVAKLDVKKLVPVGEEGMEGMECLEDMKDSGTTVEDTEGYMSGESEEEEEEESEEDKKLQKLLAQLK